MRPWSSALLSAAVLVACGSRTGLLVPGEEEPANPVDGSTVVPPPGDDDSGEARDAGPDVSEIRDALPTIDVTVPMDAFNDCPDAGATLIYVVTKEDELLSFYPPTRPVPVHRASDVSDGQPRSQPLLDGGRPHRDRLRPLRGRRALSREHRHGALPGHDVPVRPVGVPRSLRHGLLARQCGHGRDALRRQRRRHDDPASSPRSTRVRLPCASWATCSRASTTPSSPVRGAGDLFAFFATSGTAPCDNTNNNGSCTDSAIGQLDKTTGKVIAQSVLKGDRQGQAWAFGFWGGDFYTFTAPGSGTIVNRFNPTDGTLVTVATRPDLIVGAGVSTCAPAQ